MWLSAGYISSVARRSLTNSMRLINRIRARWFSFSGYYSSPHISKTAYLKQLIKGAASSVTLSFRSAEPVFSLRLPCCESLSSAFPSLLYRPRLSINSFAPQPRSPVRSLFPCSPFCLLSPSPFDRRGLCFHSLGSVGCQLSIISVLIQCNLIIKCKLTYIYILILIVLSLHIVSYLVDQDRSDCPPSIW